MSLQHSGNIQPGLDYEEHDGVNNAKRVTLVSSAATINLTTKISDGTDTAQVEKASNWAGTGGAVALLDPSVFGLTVSARNHQLWPLTGSRVGVAGDGQYYGQLMNDLGDLVVSLGSITSASGSIQIATGAGNSSTGTQRVVIASNQATIAVKGAGTAGTPDANVLSVQGISGGTVLPVGDNSGSLTVDAPVGTPVFETPTPSVGGGSTPYSNTALSNTKQQISAAACTVTGWAVHNPAAATTYIQIWDLASASVTVGTTAPTWTLVLPAGATANVFDTGGIKHATGFTIAATTTATGSTAPATAAVVSFFYKA